MIHKVNDITQAVMLLGRPRVESIVLSHAVKKALPKVDEPWFDMAQFWSLSGLRAVLARNFAQHLHPETAINSFTAAMLQDIGMPVLISKKGKQYSSIFEQWLEEKCEISLLEEKEFSFDHQRVGHLMAEEWQFPEYLTDVIGQHHFSKTVDPAISLVSKLELKNIDGEMDYIIGRCADEFNLQPEQSQIIIDQAIKEASTISFA